jgi:hypothetical protein
MITKKVIQEHQLTSDESLSQRLSNTIEKLFASLSIKGLTKERPTFTTKKKVDEILPISQVSIEDWTKPNILTVYRISYKKRLQRHQVESALTKINN